MRLVLEHSVDGIFRVQEEGTKGKAQNLILNEIHDWIH